jgi:pyridoxal phosphate enzyme (YggS family)
MTERSLNNTAETEESIAERCAEFDRNYADVMNRIASAAVKSGRRPEDICLLAATKTIPVEVINHAIAGGVTLIGENRVQELCSKYDDYDKSAERHLIGHLQTNKVRKVIGKVSMIESVDSLHLAKEISRCSEEQGIVTEILVEVNIGGEQSKSGVMPYETEKLLSDISCFSGIKVKGLMTIPPICDEKEKNCAYFAQMYNLFVDISRKKIDNIDMRYLSMGMSNDFEDAILNGANIVRVGTRLFGSRFYPNRA